MPIPQNWVIYFLMFPKIGYDLIPTDLMNSPDLVSSLPYLKTRLDDLEKK